MRPCRRLGQLRRAALDYHRRLREVAGSACAGQTTPGSRRAIAFVTLELQNNWASFARSFYLSCVLECVSVSGATIGPTAFNGSSLNDAIGVAVRHVRPNASPKATGEWRRRDEPTWHNPNVLLDLAALTGLSNLGQIQAAISMQTRVFEHLTVFRNFFAHRNAGTAKAAQAIAFGYSIAGDSHPADIVREHPARRSCPLLLDWIDDISLVTEYICE